MKILFSAFINPLRKSGVDKKIHGQIKALEKLGHDVWYFIFKDSCMYLCHGDEKVLLSDSVQQSPVGYYMAIEKGMRKSADMIDLDMVYIRRIFCTPFHLKTLSLLKAKGIVTVEELPTYPYDEENKKYTSKAYKVAAVVDKICRGNFKKHLDYFVTYSEDSTIFGVNCINLENGIDMDNIRFTPTVFADDRIDMIAVSVMAPWHGYERILEGMRNYYAANPQKPVYFHMVGDGAEKENWEKLSKEYGLEEYVTFYGHLTGDSLSAIFDRCQIGIASLGFYKINLTSGSPLKIREYTAMGKPFIYANCEQRLDDVCSFCMRISNDPTPVDINQVVEFYNRISAVEDISVNMHEFANNNYSWDIQMKKVIDKIAEHTK